MASTTSTWGHAPGPAGNDPAPGPSAPSEGGGVVNPPPFDFHRVDQANLDAGVQCSHYDLYTTFKFLAVNRISLLKKRDGRPLAVAWTTPNNPGAMIDDPYTTAVPLQSNYIAQGITRDRHPTFIAYVFYDGQGANEMREFVMNAEELTTTDRSIRVHLGLPYTTPDYVAACSLARPPPGIQQAGAGAGGDLTNILKRLKKTCHVQRSGVLQKQECIVCQNRPDRECKKMPGDENGRCTWCTWLGKTCRKDGPNDGGGGGNDGGGGGGDDWQGGGKLRTKTTPRRPSVVVKRNLQSTANAALQAGGNRMAASGPQEKEDSRMDSGLSGSTVDAGVAADAADFSDEDYDIYPEDERLAAQSSSFAGSPLPTTRAKVRMPLEDDSENSSPYRVDRGYYPGFPVSAARDEEFPLEEKPKPRENPVKMYTKAELRERRQREMGFDGAFDDFSDEEEEDDDDESLSSEEDDEVSDTEPSADHRRVVAAGKGREPCGRLMLEEEIDDLKLEDGKNSGCSSKRGSLSK